MRRRLYAAIAIAALVGVRPDVGTAGEGWFPEPPTFAAALTRPVGYQQALVCGPGRHEAVAGKLEVRLPVRAWRGRFGRVAVLGALAHESCALEADANDQDTVGLRLEWTPPARWWP